MSDPNPLKYNFGDTHDDDGQVFEQYFETANAPATPQIDPIPAPELPTIVLPNKLITLNLHLEPTWSPTLILPADRNRESLQLYLNNANGETGTVYFYASDEGTLQTQGGLPPAAIGGTTIISLDSYTGPLWAVAVPTSLVAAGGAVRLNVCAVTS